MSLLGRQDFVLPSFYVMRPAVPQKPQAAAFALKPVTILQTHVSSNPFKINTYKPTSQLLILNHLRVQLNPLDATLTQKPGGGAGLVRRESCMEVEILTSHLSPLLSTPCALFCPTEPSQLLCNQSVPTLCVATEGVAPYLLASLPPHVPEPAQRFQLRSIISRVAP